LALISLSAIEYKSDNQEGAFLHGLWRHRRGQVITPLRHPQRTEEGRECPRESEWEGGLCLPKALGHVRLPRKEYLLYIEQELRVL
jgi:hypothetical protein